MIQFRYNDAELLFQPFCYQPPMVPYLHYVEFEVKENLRLKDRQLPANSRTSESGIRSGRVAVWRSIDCTQNC